jgi:hypothetical protein
MWTQMLNQDRPQKILNISRKQNVRTPKLPGTMTLGIASAWTQAPVMFQSVAIQTYKQSKGTQVSQDQTKKKT